MAATFPDGVALTTRQFAVGRREYDMTLPERYYDWSFIMAHFPAPTRLVTSLLPSDALQAVEVVPGTAVVTLAAFEYRRMAQLKPYNEVGIMVPVRHRPASRVPLLPLLLPERYDVGFWVHHLPVTTREACDVGIGLWGLPKVVAEIEFSDVGWTRRCELREDGQHVLTLSSAMAETRLETRRFHAFSVLDGTLLRSLVDTRAHYHAWYVPGRASFTLGTHPVADELRSLEVRRLAIAGLFAFTARSRLHLGTAVSADELADCAPPTSP